jgi:hypothetical protein
MPYTPVGIHGVRYTVDIERSARLGAVRWMAARGLDDEQLIKRTRQTGQFQLALNNTPCDLGRNVSDFTDPNNECHLKLIVSHAIPQLNRPTRVAKAESSHGGSNRG